MHLFAHNHDPDYYFDPLRQEEPDVQPITRCYGTHPRLRRTVYPGVARLRAAISIPECAIPNLESTRARMRPREDLVCVARVQKVAGQDR